VSDAKPPAPATSPSPQATSEPQIAPTAQGTSLLLVEQPRSLAEIMTDVRRSHAEVMAGLSHSAAKAIRAGEFLVEAKDQLKHGEFQLFVTLDCGIAQRTAQIYMKLASHKDKLIQLVDTNARRSAGLSQAQALKFLASTAKKSGRGKTRKPDAKKEPKRGGLLAWLRGRSPK
jgi:hypothetical protein